MSTNKMLGIVLLIAGAVLIYFGMNAANSPMEEVSEAVTGRYTDQTMWYIIGGAVAAVLGLVLVVKK